VKSFFDFNGRTEIKKYSRLSRNAETGDSDKEALFASAGGVEVSEFLGGETRLATRGARRWSWTILEVNFILSYLIKKKQRSYKDRCFFSLVLSIRNSS
jgi:hypothetical protein